MACRSSKRCLVTSRNVSVTTSVKNCQMQNAVIECLVIFIISVRSPNQCFRLLYFDKPLTIEKIKLYVKTKNFFGIGTKTHVSYQLVAKHFKQISV